MNPLRGDARGQALAPGRGAAASVLADRISAALLHHEPGWRLPRYSALARRYSVSVAQIEAAIELLVTRHLLTRLPDGQVFRASPAEYRLALEGLPGFATRIDPMGAELTCKSRSVAKRRAPEDITRALGVPPGDQLLTIRCLWTVSGQPGAYSASYLPTRMEELAGEFGAAAPPGGPVPQPGRASAFQLEVQPPAPQVARSLNLGCGEPATTVTVTFEDPAHHEVIALAVAVLRPDLFRIVVEAPPEGQPAAGPPSFPGAWTHPVGDWEP